LQQTKLLHEGYATFWHRRILHDLTLGTPAFFPFLQQHTQVLSGPGHPLHPYRDGDALIRAVIAQSGGLQALDSLITSGTDAMLLHRYWTPTPESMSTLAKETFPDPNDDPMVLKSAIIDRIVHPAPPITVDSATTQTTGHLQLRTPTFPRDLDQPRLQAALHCVAQSLWRAPVTLISEVSSDRWTANPA
jgi:spore cortex formation protein SpoVR/YcgB (stage V sporulation)